MSTWSPSVVSLPGRSPPLLVASPRRSRFSRVLLLIVLLLSSPLFILVLLVGLARAVCRWPISETPRCVYVARARVGQGKCVTMSREVMMTKALLIQVVMEGVTTGRAANAAMIGGGDNDNAAVEFYESRTRSIMAGNKRVG